MAKKDRIYFKPGPNGSLVPADPCAARQIAERGYKAGQVLQVEIFKLRSQGLNRFAHHIGGLVVENLDAFAGMEPHKALKRLQIESRTACDEVGIHFPGVGMCMYIIPRSFSFESMTEDEFREAVAGICRYISERYWPNKTPDQIESMADQWGRMQ